MAALNSALKVKQFITATKSKNKINILQRVFTARAAPITITQMVYDSELCDNEFIREALDTIGNLNNIVLTVVLLRVLRFLPTIPPLGGGMPPMIWQR